MFSVLLLLVSSALAAGHLKVLECSTWIADSENGAGFTATGSTKVWDMDGKVKASVTDLMPMKDGNPEMGEFVAHVHVAACSTGGGAHWKIDTTNNGTVRANELWVGPITLDATTTKFTGEDITAVDAAINDQVQSVVIHQKDGEMNPKRLCCDLVAAEGEGEGEGEHGGEGEGEGDGEGEHVHVDCQDIKTCTACTEKEGCTFCAGGQTRETLPKSACIETSNLEDGKCPSLSPDKIESVDECIYDKNQACEKNDNCGDCIDAEGCWWCDTAAKATGGLTSSGSCNWSAEKEGDCLVPKLSPITDKAECASASTVFTAVSVVIVAVATLF